MRVILGVFGIGIVAVLAYFFAPWFMQKRVNETVTDVSLPADRVPASAAQEDMSSTALSAGSGGAVATLRQGAFEGITVHQASGTAKLLQSGNATFIRFEDDFEVTNGPDLVVYLGKNGAYDPNAALGELKGNSGGQNYLIPASINPDEYDEVWVWCRKFSVGFGKTVLR